jgi:hypothetical protein
VRERRGEREERGEGGGQVPKNHDSSKKGGEKTLRSVY